MAQVARLSRSCSQARTWVVIDEVKSGHWAIGGVPLTTAEVKALAKK